MRCSVDQIIIEPGIYYCLNLITPLIKKDLFSVAIEDPGHLRVQNNFLLHGIKVHPIPIDAKGLDIEKLKSSPANAVFVTPSHQFPTGIIMPLSRRLELTEWAKENHALIIENDYNSHFRYYEQPIPSLQSFAPDNVIYISSFSKNIFPSIRIAYMVLPKELMQKFHIFFKNCPSSVPFLMQKSLESFIKEGCWDSHLRKFVRKQRIKHDILIAALNEEFGDKIHVSGLNAGLHLMVKVKWPMEEDELVSRAYRAGIRVIPVSAFATSPPDKYGAVLLSFGGIRAEDIPTGIHFLRQAWLGS